MVSSARKADFGRGLQGRRVHHAPAAQDHPIRFELPHLKPLRLLLVAGWCHRDVRHRKTILLRLRVQHRSGLLAVSRVVIKVHDLLALELVHSAFLHSDEFDLGGVLTPVVRDHRKDIGKPPPIGGIGPAVADGHQRDLVHRDFVQHRVGNAGRQRIEGDVAGRPPGLQPLIAFDPARIVVFRLALFPDELDAVDAALAFVDQGHVVDPAPVNAGAAGRVGPDAISRQPDELLAFRR